MSTSGPNNVDMDALLDFSEYDNSYNSPSLSPSTTSKPTFASPVSAAVSTPSLSSSSQPLSGPSHNYDMHRQQTGFVPGAIANTMAVNQTNNTGYQDFGSLDYISGYSPENEMFDFNTSPSQATTMDLEFETSQQLFPTVNPSSIEQNNSAPPQTTSSVGRLWPGAHSQAALVKAQSQHRQQHPQRQNAQKPRSKAPQPTDPIVEQKITQLLNSMRAKPASSEQESQSALNSFTRNKKDEDEMDEDERLLASEEGKKLSSKERRQLRNKVSARAFRSRRKEYITQLESEIATKVNENGDLRAQNRALLDENKRLSDLTRMLLSSPSFSNFLDHLSTNPHSIAPTAPVKVEQPQQQEQNQIPKDVNPYNGQVSSHEQIGMAMIPEQSMDFSLLNLDNSSYSFQPQVFVVDTPEMPNVIDVAALSGKTSNFVDESLSSEDEKVEIPVIERPVELVSASIAHDEGLRDEEFENDPDFALFHSEPAGNLGSGKPLDTEKLAGIDLFGGLKSEKMFARYELVDATEEEASAVIAMSRVQRISASMESVVSRLELLTMDL